MGVGSRGRRADHHDAARTCADLDRAASGAGLALRMLHPQRDTLETVFLNLTGSSDAKLAEQRGAQREDGRS